MELILLRHGLTQGNVERRFVGVTDLPLLSQGEEEARRFAAHSPAVDALYVSPLIRCRRTAELAWPGVPQRILPGLRETDFGPFEGKSHQECVGDPLYDAWLAAGGETFTLPGMETPRHCLRRVTGAVAYLLRDAQSKGAETAAAVTHGGVVMTLLERFGQPRRSYYDWLLPNCAAYRLRVERDPLIFTLLETILP